MARLLVSSVALRGQPGRLRVSRIALAGTAAPTSSRLLVSSVRASGVVVVERPRLLVARVALTAVNSTLPPLVSASRSTLTVDSGERIVVNGFDSDTDGAVVARKWTLNGTVLTTGSILNLRAPVVLSDTMLTYVYTATDNDGLSDSVGVIVTVLRAPIIIRNPAGVLSGYVFRTFTAEEVAALNPVTTGPRTTSPTLAPSPTLTTQG